MVEQQLTYESVLGLFREAGREIGELRLSIKEQGAEFRQLMLERDTAFDRRVQERDAEYARIAKKTNKEINKKIGDLTGSIGRVIEHMVAGDNIIKKFQALDYEIDTYARNKKFGHSLPKEMRGEIDLFLEDGDVAILIEVKTTLETSDVRRHIRTLEKFRCVSDIKGDKRRFIGAVAGAVVKGDAEEIAHENGMYVIVQSGKAMEILPVPEGFKAREW